METKVCNKCGRELPIENFSKCSSTKDGLQYNCKECNKNYRSNQSEKIKEYLKEYRKKYYLEHKEPLNERGKLYYAKHRTEYSERAKRYIETKIGRATILLTRYNSADLEKGRGKGDLTAEWIVENIFTKPCAHCGETDWHKIGCNRIDNSKPHTMDNVEPCCGECNRKLR
jgi:hypothetical protein